MVPVSVALHSKTSENQTTRAPIPARSAGRKCPGACRLAGDAKFVGGGWPLQRHGRAPTQGLHRTDAPPRPLAAAPGDHLASHRVEPRRADPCPSLGIDERFLECDVLLVERRKDRRPFPQRVDIAAAVSGRDRLDVGLEFEPVFLDPVVILLQAQHGIDKLDRKSVV